MRAGELTVPLASCTTLELRALHITGVMGELSWPNHWSPVWWLEQRGATLLTFPPYHLQQVRYLALVL